MIPTDIKLDWHPPAPERRVASQRYRVAAIAEQTPEFHLNMPVHNRSWKRKLWLNQGKEGACTGFGAAHCLGIGYKFWNVDDNDARQFYFWARRNDEYAGENYEGSSVHGAAQGLKVQGLIHEYWWAETLDELMHAVSIYGAVECGTDVYTGWFSPDSDGVITNSGKVEGGHAYAVSAIDLKKHRARIDQSWGKDFGLNGCVYIDLDELGNLLAANGECALFRKNLFNAALLPKGPAA